MAHTKLLMAAWKCIEHTVLYVWSREKWTTPRNSEQPEHKAIRVCLSPICK